MEIRVDAVIAHPRALVFAAYRDGLAELTERMPNIASVQVVLRTERPGEIDLVTDWVGGGDIPAAARAFLNVAMLRWTDHATWFESDHHVTWRTDAHAFHHAIQSAGTNRFIEIPEGTRFELRGDLTCDASKIPAVPRLLAKTVGGTVEKVMVGQIAKNATEMARNVARMITSQSAAR